jgi:hypothetical protein
MTRKILAVLIVALAIPGAARASRTQSTAAKKVTYVLKGTLFAYSAASSAADGSITIHVSSANDHSRLLTGKDLTFAITAKTTVTLNGNPTIVNGSRGVIKFRAPRNMTSSALMTALRPGHMKAREVIDQGRLRTAT